MFNTLLMTLLVATSPLWSVLFIWLRYMFEMYVWDFDNPYFDERLGISPFLYIFFYKLMFLGFGQLLLAMLGVWPNHLILCAYPLLFLSLLLSHDDP